MKVIDWNIQLKSEINDIIALLKEKAAEEQCIIGLQEVLPEKADKIKSELGDKYHIVYSLIYREPDEFDGLNRRMGVMLLVSKDMVVVSSGIFERNIFPERSLHVEVSYGNKLLRIANFHSLTGCSYGMAKAAQYRTLAACIKQYNPDIIMMDANEPKIDHYDIREMEFWEQSKSEAGSGARAFFEEIVSLDMVDTFAVNYNKEQYIEGKPLAVSFIVNPRKTERRYDFIFAKKDYEVSAIGYLYNESVAAGSDHAMVVAELNL